ncbi:MAG: penicillin-insensitive murein endopeptidase, partial [Pseudomonadota bacterium]
MVRFIAAALIILGLTGCQSEPTAEIVSQNANDNRIAKTLFGAAPIASPQRPEAIGGYSRGC